MTLLVNTVLYGRLVKSACLDALGENTVIIRQGSIPDVDLNIFYKGLVIYYCNCRKVGAPTVSVNIYFA